MKKIGLAIHGGAGTILKSQMTSEKESKYKKALEEALMEGWNALLKNMSSVDAVQNAVKSLEDNALFNAGKGSVFTHEGKHEMDASIMNGKDLRAGAVSLVANIRNPIMLARKIMDESEYIYLGGKGAEEFARQKNIAFEEDDYFYDEYRYQQLLKSIEENKMQLDHSAFDSQEKQFGTVGAVALDAEGNMAAATSTGGMTNKKFGRIGDSPLIGAGTYANNKTCAVSCTGNGEYFIRTLAAYDVSALMEYRNFSLKDASDIVIHQKIESLKGEGGLVAIDVNCNISMTFNSKGMYRACIKTGSNLEIRIFDE